MKVQEHFEILNYNTSILRTPFTIAHILVTVIVTILSSLNDVSVIEILLFIVGCSLLSMLHWYGNRIYIRLGTFYLLIQSLLVFLTALFVHDFAIIVLIVFGGTLITQSFYLYNKAKNFFTFLVFYIVYSFFVLTIMYEQDKLAYAIFIFLISLLFILLGFATFNQKEVENRELLLANKRVEALTKQNERQRMARDLHDSLIQRLIGVNLKMEVMEEYLEDGDMKEATDILKLVKTQVEQSIVEAREVVDDLRLSEEIMINHRLKKEVVNLMTLFSIPIDLDVENNIVVDEKIANHIIAILKEAVTNTFKHAQAKTIQVTAHIHNNLLVFKIEDDGVGYKQASDSNHYGIIGMKERTEILNGHFNIVRQSDKGTKIEIKIPI